MMRVVVPMPGADKSLDEKLAEAKLDREFEDHDIEKVYEDQGYLVVTTEAGFSLAVANPLGAPPVAAGDRLRFFGEGLGRVVRGVGRLSLGEVTALYYYATKAEADAAHEAWVAEQRAERRRKWEEQKDEHAAKIKALPDAFQRRIDFFLRRPDWGPEFGPYEIFVCTEAVKILAALTADGAKGLEGFGTPRVVRSFHRLGSDEQRKIVPDLSTEHSGNTFGAACHLVEINLIDPELVPRAHGALCPLLGCDAYGCWSTTAQVEN